MKWLAAGFLGFGLLWAAVTALVARDLLLVGDRARARGVVVEDYRRGGEHAPVVAFPTAAGDTSVFVSEVWSPSPRYGAGDAVAVLYDPARPSRAVVEEDGRWLGPGVFASFAVVFGAVGAAFAVSAVRRSRRRAWLRRSGVAVEARLVEVVRDRSTRRNGRSPYRLAVQWQDPATDRVWTFESPAVWFDPSPYVEPGQAVPALVDPADPARHLVDLSFLPETGR